MDNKLLFQAIGKFLAGLVAVGALLFVSAGTLRYWNAWLFIAILFIPMFIAGLVMLKKAPALLEKRLSTDERESEQRRVILLSALMFTGGFVVAGLDFRLGWSKISKLAVAVAAIVFLLSYALYAEVMRENAFLSRTVEVQDKQTVVDAGLYGVVRHPMYLATVLLFLSMPLVLGSLYAFAIFLIYPFLIVKRIKNEEKVLAEGLAGYAEYMKKVKYRLIPFVW